MSTLSKLAGQTFWYGLSSIIGRFINYLLTPLLTGIYASGKYGDISILFALAAFLNIVFSFGMETTYFRFSRDMDEKRVFNTGQTLLILTTLLLYAGLLAPLPALASLMRLETHPEYLRWVLWIVALDTLAVLPFSRLRHLGRPRMFAILKLLGILVNVGLVVFFLVLCKGDHEKGRNTLWAALYKPDIDIGYVFLANLAASAATLLLLHRELLGWRPAFDFRLLGRMLAYASPLLVVGFGGMVNETIDRFMILERFAGTVEEARSANGIYSANYKLAVLIVLFIQAFRMGAEPFFFRQSAENTNAPVMYARVMKFFVIACCLGFLGVVLFLDVWKHFMGIRRHPEYLQGLMIVPVLMLAKIFLGVYYNLSIWYKLTDRTLTGAWITLGGALVTVAVNYLLIPHLGYMACAWATFLCYGSMMVASYRLGQRHYRVPYAWKKLTAYVVICVMLFLAHQVLRQVSPGIAWNHAGGVAGILLFLAIVARVERRELAGMRIPGIGQTRAGT
ncbi:MAG: polysaccharide biosynthesis protein [Chitinophagia bacterium]|nr:polysaccharide biosynthesis protein [Chitinophagia bacterium]